MSIEPPGRPATVHPLRRALTLWGALIALMWLILITDAATPAALTQWGVQPRSLDGLIPGVIAMPFLHAGIGHLTSNMVPLAVLGTIAALRDWRSFWIATAVIVTVSGLGVWLFEDGLTVGASGVVFGYFGYLLGRGIFMRRLGDIAIAVLVILVYGSMIWGILPSDPRISWLAHLFGFLAGLAAAFVLARHRTITARTA
jgi:membrane associated rhomboid family serine protease